MFKVKREPASIIFVFSQSSVKSTLNILKHYSLYIIVRTHANESWCAEKWFQMSTIMGKKPDERCTEARARRWQENKVRCLWDNVFLGLILYILKTHKYLFLYYEVKSPVVYTYCVLMHHLDLN